MAFNLRDSIFREMEETYHCSPVKEINPTNLKLVLFSDIHKGIRDGADDFKQCRTAYHGALNYYFENGYSIGLLGDIEELWECRAIRVLKSHTKTFELEKKFADSNRYIRIWGNHDDFWDKSSVVRKLLGRLTHLATVDEALRIPFRTENTNLEFFLVHGHQGTAESDRFKLISKFFVRYIWRNIQRIFRIKSATPAKDFQLRREHERIMHEWAASKSNLVMIAGHTHHPVFMAKAHDDVLRAQIAEQRKRLPYAENDEERDEIEGNIRSLNEELEKQLSKSDGVASGLNQSLKPCYFNTGCCCYSDGDITAIELERDTIRLVRWPDDDGNMNAKVLAEEKVEELGC